MAKLGVVIPAAGSGKRMGMGLNKQFLNLEGVPILACSLRTFQISDRVSEIVVVGAKDDIFRIREIIRNYNFDKVINVVTGGADRQESVLAGVKALSTTTEIVVVHDGARPLLTLDLFHSFLEEAEGVSAAVMAVPVKDTIKCIDQKGWVIDTPAREQLRSVQTPQLFERAILEEAHYQAKLKKFIGTDDASLLECLGYPVKVLEGSYENIKITTPDDLWIAKRILEGRKQKSGG